MNRPTLPSTLETVSQLAARIYDGTAHDGFVGREQCLFLADQVTAQVCQLAEELRRGRLPEVLALRPLGSAALFTKRTADCARALELAVGSARETLEAVADDDFFTARQAVSGCLYVLWQFNMALWTLAAEPTADSTAFTVTQGEEKR